MNLRRLNGLDGHPDISVDGIEANTGSLGMGISKAKGIAWTKKYLKLKGDVVVVIGDGRISRRANIRKFTKCVFIKILQI